MKIVLTSVLIAAASAGAYALDLPALFCGSGRPAAFSGLLAAVPPPLAPAAEKAGCALPPDIAPQEAARFVETAKPVVVDVRRPEEYAAGHLAAASLQLDYYAPDFRDQLAKLDKNAHYLIYCRSGHRSGLALAIMRELGFTDAHDIAGGINAWTAAGLPVAK
jgi:rhodanese-related sulfurtransferase